ncbi:LD-carboxypeptidase [Nemorincola caseinilytica]|uniref:LD-carboxypeptidase n=1 Tax=Nemorincola caseinilytica TaxID=2054315 RepID=A0ABP8NCK8_9BACT
MLQQGGFRVVVGKTVGSEHFYFSGTDEERLADLQSMMDDAGIDAILMGRGGYGMSRIIDRLDLSGFARRPKWICGFSDITVLHGHIQAKLGVHTIHGPMCGAFNPDTAQAPHILSVLHALRGEAMVYDMPPSPFNRVGRTQAILTGGNLAILAHLTGSASEVDTRGKILFIEDIGEHLYNIDRLLLNLKRAGKLDHLAGLLIGSFTDMQDTTRPFGQTIEQIIADKVAEYDYPVCFNFPAGHQDVNFAFVLGAMHTLEVTTQGSVLSLVRDNV